MQTATPIPVSPRLPRHLPQFGAYSGYPCPLRGFSPTRTDPSRPPGDPVNAAGRIPASAGRTTSIHARELSEILSPEALAGSPFAVSRWWSIRERTRRFFSGLGLL